jgi:hypothetical protein
MWEYQVELNPNQTKNIWLINGTYSIASLFQSSIVLVNNGAFPPIYPSPTPTMTPSVTPTNTPTPSVTATNTPTPTTTTTLTTTPTNTGTPTNTPTPTNTGTPTNTPTNTQTGTAAVTPTPTNIIRTTLSNVCHDESDPNATCNCLNNATLFVNGTNLSDSTLAWSDATGVNTGNPEGYYNENGIIYQVSTDCGPGCITGSTISVYGNCPTTTPTPTQTGTPNVTATPTNTGTPTNTPTPTNSRVQFNITSGTTSNAACDLGDAGIIYGEDPVFDNNLQFFNSSTGPVTIDMTGYYANGGLVVFLNSTGNESGGFFLCSALPTLTPTPTSTVTPTVTTTNTPSPTPTIGYYIYSLGYDAGSSVTACGAVPSNYYLSPSLNPLNVGDTIYTDTSLTTPASDGYYSNGTGWYLITGGSGLITSGDPNGC